MSATQDRKIIACISSGGALSNNRLLVMGHAGSKICFHCGEATQTIQHNLWHCHHPQLICARAALKKSDLNFKNPNPVDFIPVLLLGIPPALVADLTLTFWGTSFALLRTTDQHSIRSMGCHGRFWKAGLDRRTDHLFGNFKPTGNARQTLVKLMHQQQCERLPS